MWTASEYLLAGCATEVERLRIQALTWELDVETMLDEIGIDRGWTCIDVGCGSMGIIGSLARRVGPFGKVYALDWDPLMLDAAREYVDREGFGNVLFQQGDLFSNDLPPQSFDLVHARFMLAPIGREREILEQLTSLVRRGGIVALEEPDARTWRCDPPSAEWERIKTTILNVFEQGGGDFNVGRRLGSVLRRSGVEPVSVRETTLTLPGRHPYSSLILGLAESLRSKVISERLLTGTQFEQCIRSCEEVLRSPYSLTQTFRLVQAWGRPRAATT